MKIATFRGYPSYKMQFNVSANTTFAFVPHKYQDRRFTEGYSYLIYDVNPILEKCQISTNDNDIVIISMKYLVENFTIEEVPD